MAASFHVMNQVFGALFDASLAEAQTPEMANQRAKALAGQFIMDTHTHFLRDDTRLTGFVSMREAVGKAGWNKAIGDKPQTIDDLKYDNYFKEIYLDSDTKVALISNAPSEIPEDWFLTNDMVFQTRAKVNEKAGSKRMLAHYIITPGQKGWMEGIDRAIEVSKPDSWKGYTVGDNTHKELSNHPYRLDDEKLMYPAYEKFAKSGIKNVCIHKGLWAARGGSAIPQTDPLRKTGRRGQSGQGLAAAKLHHLPFGISPHRRRSSGGVGRVGKRPDRISWVSDLAEIPGKYGVKNVYADLGQVMAYSTVVNPRLAAALLGVLIKGLGVDHVIWGTDAVWTGSPQWQIEGLRRLEIPDDMQKKHGFKPLGAADGPVKNAIFGLNVAKLYNYPVESFLKNKDHFAGLRAEYEEQGPERSNLRYGYVPKPA